MANPSQYGIEKAYAAGMAAHGATESDILQAIGWTYPKTASVCKESSNTGIWPAPPNSRYHRPDLHHAPQRTIHLSSQDAKKSSFLGKSGSP